SRPEKPRAGRGTAESPILDGFLEFLGRAESDFLAGLDLDLFAGRRVTAHARRTLADLQNPETADADLVTFLEMLRQQTHEVGEDFARDLLRELMLVGERRRQMLQRDNRRLIG